MFLSISIPAFAQDVYLLLERNDDYELQQKVPEETGHISLDLKFINYLSNQTSVSLHEEIPQINVAYRFDNNFSLALNYEQFETTWAGQEAYHVQLIGLEAGYTYQLNKKLSIYGAAGFFWPNWEESHSNTEASRYYQNILVGEKGCFKDYSVETQPALGIMLSGEAKISDHWFANIGLRWLQLPYNLYGYNTKPKKDLYWTTDGSIDASGFWGGIKYTF